MCMTFDYRKKKAVSMKKDALGMGDPGSYPTTFDVLKVVPRAQPFLDTIHVSAPSTSYTELRLLSKILRYLAKFILIDASRVLC
jgi:hypothetical protein